jgi:hypothetical protein
MDRSKLSKSPPNAVLVDGLFFPQREALGLDTRESTPGFKRQIIVLNAEVRSMKRVSLVMQLPSLVADCQSVVPFSMNTAATAWQGATCW